MKFDKHPIYKISVIFFWILTFAYLGSKEGYAVGRSLTFLFLLISSVGFCLLFKRIYFGVLVGAVLTLTVYFVSLAKYQNMGITFNFSDFSFYFGSPIETIKIFYDYVSFIEIAIIIGASTLLLFFFNIENRSSFFENHPKKYRYFFLAVVVLLCRPTLKSYAVYLYGSPAKLAEITMKQSPSISTFVASMGVDGISIPNFPEEESDFSKRFGAVISKNLNEVSKMPNVFVWLEESTFDPRLLKGCDFDQCYSRIFSAKSENEFFNPLRVHTWGGGTWTSEFSFLTGLDHRMFGPLGAAAPLTLAPRMNMALPKYLSQLGYETIAIYPVRKAYLNAGPAYRAYGFDQVIDILDEGEGDTWKSSDKRLFEIFKRIIDRQSQKKPLFVFMLTIYQHGPHQNTDEKPRTGGFKAPILKAYSAELNERIGNYLDRLKQSERVLIDAREYIENKFKYKKWVFGHFGDHHPSLGETVSSEAMYSNEVRKRFNDVQYITYFKMEANFPLVADHYPEIDLAFLGNYILSSSNIPLNNFYLANQVLLNECEGRYMLCKNQRIWKEYNNYIFKNIKVVE